MNSDDHVAGEETRGTISSDQEGKAVAAGEHLEDQRMDGLAAKARRSGCSRSYGIGNWDDLRLVLALERAGNFHAAATILGANQSTISRRLNRLEAALGTKIFERHGHGLRSTPAGACILEKASLIEGVAAEINSKLSALDILPKGTVKISVTEGIGYLWLTPVMAEFCAIHDDIDIDIITNGEGYDLILDGADLALGLQRPENIRLVAAKVGSVSFSLCASSSYFAKHAGLRGDGSAEGHNLVEYTPYNSIPSTRDWLGHFKRSARVRLSTNSAAVYLSAITSGVGIGLLPAFYARHVPELRFLQTVEAVRSPLWIVSHEETNQTRRIRLVPDYLNKRLAEDRAKWFQ